MSNTNWVDVYSSQFLHKVEIAQAILKEYSIVSVIQNKQDSLYKFGYIELYVKTKDAMEAKQILEKNKP